MKIAIVYISLLLCLFSCKENETELPEPADTYSESPIKKIFNPKITVLGKENVSPGTPLQVFIDGLKLPFAIPDNGEKRFFTYLIDSVYVLNGENANMGIEVNEYNKKILPPDTLTFHLKEKLEYDKAYQVFIKLVFFEKIEEEWVMLPEEEDLENNSIIKTSFSTRKMNEDIIHLNRDTLEFFKGINLKSDLYPEIEFYFVPEGEFTFSREGNKLYTGRLHVDEIYLMENGVRKEILLKYDQNSRIYRLSYTQPFIPGKEYSYVLKVNFQEKKEDEWVPLEYNGEREKFVIEKSLPINIGNISGDLLPDVYIDGIYPMPRQFNFYRHEYPKGFIKFPFSPELIPQISSTEKFSFRFTKLPDGEVIHNSEGAFDAEENIIWYDLPDNFEKETPYRVEMFSDNELFYKTEFRVSKHDFFMDKIPENLNVRFYYHKEVELSEFLTVPIDYLGTAFYLDEGDEGDEGLDYYEINRETLKVTLQIDQWNVYQNSIFKYIYENYPVIPSARVSRNIDEVGIPPRRTILIWQTDFNRKLTDEEIQTGDFNYEVEKYNILNESTLYWLQDYYDTHVALQKFYSSESEIKEPELKEIFNTEIPEVLTSNYFNYGSWGNYEILFEYRLPGTDIVTSSKTLTIVNDPL